MASSWQARSKNSAASLFGDDDAAAFAAALGLEAEAISVEASFFELGGNSLRAVALARRLSDALGTVPGRSQDALGRPQGAPGSSQGGLESSQGALWARFVRDLCDKALR